MPITFQCPHCSNVTQVGDEYVGQTGPCNSCGQTVTVTAQQAPVKVKVPANARHMSGLLIAVFVAMGVCVCGGLGLIPLLIPAFQASSEAARRAQCSNNLKQIGLAMHNYHDTHKAFPPAYTVDADGNKLHSWRTLLLPFLDQAALYDQIDLNSPWDSSRNRHISRLSIPVYSCPSAQGVTGQTNYMAIVGPGSIFEGPNQIGIRDITDGTANTILIAEVVGTSTSWMEPTDLDLETMQMLINGGNGEIGSDHPGGVQVALADGSVRFIAAGVDVKLLESLITRNGGELMSLP